MIFSRVNLALKTGEIGSNLVLAGTYVFEYFYLCRTTGEKIHPGKCMEHVF